MNNILSLYIFKILINVASHSYIHQSRYKTATVDIQRGLPEIILQINAEFQEVNRVVSR